MKASVIQLFEQTFREEPQFLVRSPGRVNLIGEHTDYNDGFVLPLAIDYAVWIALSPSSDRRVSLNTDDLKESASFHLDNFTQSDAGWLEYIKGVAFSLQQKNISLAGWKGCILSNLPIAAGLSSSAALEIGAITAFAAVSSFSVPREEMALMGQQAENEWVGMNCGIMDQLASACGIRDHTLFIDCRTLEMQPVPLPHNCLVAILDTSTRRKLVASEYNMRREQCHTAARFFEVPALRDLTPKRLQAAMDGLDETIGKRALHVVSENNRVISTVDHLKKGNLRAAGRLLVESHDSLRDLYEVSSPALDSIVEAALKSSGCYGARMTGAGFGGCAVALVDKNAAEQFTEEVVQTYFASSRMKAEVYLTSATDGTELIPLS